MKDSTDQSATIEMPAELRRDVRLLSSLLGVIITESDGEDLLADVEELRALTIAAYGGDDEKMALAQDLVDSLSPTRAALVARAFTCYFHLVNAAEEYHRVRALRSRAQSESEVPRPGTFLSAFNQLCDEVGLEKARKQLADLEFRPVFTAHPTEVRRRAVFTAVRRISVLLEQLDDPRIGGSSAAALERQILEEINVLWRTAPVRTSAPTPMDEVRTLMSVFDATLFEQLPQIYRQFDAALQPEATGLAPPIVPAFVKVGTWIGGDRDGNPNVLAQTTMDAAATSAEHILLGLEKHTRRLGRELTLDGERTPASWQLKELKLRQADLDKKVADEIEKRSQREPHRQALLFTAQRLRATRLREVDLAYGTPEDFLADLMVIQESLAGAGDVRSAYGELQHLIWQAQSFGFHLAELEVRQHSQVHRESLAEIEEKGLDGDLSARTQDVLETVRSIGRIQRRFGPMAARRYIVSFTQSVEDIASVYALADLAAASGPVSIDVIPLFETFADLRDSVIILDEMLQLDHVQRRLELNDRRLEVMLGY